MVQHVRRPPWVPAALDSLWLLWVPLHPNAQRTIGSWAFQEIVKDSFLICCHTWSRKMIRVSPSFLDFLGIPAPREFQSDPAVGLDYFNFAVCALAWQIDAYQTTNSMRISTQIVNNRSRSYQRTGFARMAIRTTFTLTEKNRPLAFALWHFDTFTSSDWFASYQRTGGSNSASFSLQTRRTLKQKTDLLGHYFTPSVSSLHLNESKTQERWRYWYGLNLNAFIPYRRSWRAHLTSSTRSTLRWTKIQVKNV